MGTVVTADLPFVLDPHRLLLLLASLQSGTYSKIILPDTFRFIEIWPRKLGMPFTWHVFDQSNPIDDGVARYYGFDPEASIGSDNFVAAMRLLQFAHLRGMIELFPAEEMTKRGLGILDTDKHFSDFYSRTTSTGIELTINPDLGGHTLEAVLALSIEQGVIPFFGDELFVNYLQLRKPGFHELESAFDVDPGMDKLIHCPEPASFQELTWYLEHKGIADAIVEKMDLSALSASKSKEIALVGTKFVGTTIVDTALFYGVPVTSGLMAAYDMFSRYVRKRI